MAKQKKRKSASAPPAAAPAAAPPPVPAAPPAPPAFQEPGDADGAPTHAEITRRAYEIFVKRGGRPGDPMKDWLDAEAELKAERRKGPTSRA